MDPQTARKKHIHEVIGLAQMDQRIAVLQLAYRPVLQKTQNGFQFDIPKEKGTLDLVSLPAIALVCHFLGSHCNKKARNMSMFFLFRDFVSSCHLGAVLSLDPSRGRHYNFSRPRP